MERFRLLTVVEVEATDLAHAERALDACRLLAVAGYLDDEPRPSLLRIRAAEVSGTIDGEGITCR